MSEEFKRTPEEWVAHYQNHYINTLTAEAASRIIKNDMTNVARSCISIGFHLKAVRDREMFREMGYRSLWEYAADQFGLSMSSASRYIAINDQFSVGGNTPQLQPEYRNFSKSQLQEMLNMSPEQIGQVTEDMTVKEIRKLKKPETAEPEEKKPEENIPGQMEIKDFPEVLPEEDPVATSQKQEEWNEDSSCPPGIQQCIRQEWGTSPEQQHAGQKECAKCWNDYKKTKAVLDEKKGQEKLSVYGLPLREYPEDSLIASSGCGTHDCFSCHQVGCAIRQEFCYCVEAPMANPFPCEMLDRVAELKNTKGNTCQFVDRSLAYHRAGDGEAVPCCKDCENLCEYACGKTKKALKEMGLPSPEETDQETVQLSDKDLLQSMLDEAKGQLSEYLKVDKVEKLPEEMIRKKKILVGALAAMKCDLDNAEQDKPEKPEQPELPIMKNNDQRKEWLRNYRDWGLWYEDENIGVKYYKYDFENGARLIAEVYEGNERKRTFTAVYLHLVGGPEPPKHPKYGYGKWNRHERYSKHPDSETELVEFLKEVQKNGEK